MLSATVDNFKRILRYALLLLAAAVLQTAVFSRLPLLDVKPLILPVAAAGVGVFAGGSRGAVFALFAGIVCDLTLSDSTVMFTLFLPLLAFLAGYLTENMLIRGFLTFFITAFGTALVCGLLQTFRLMVFGGAPPLPVLRDVLLQEAYSAFFALPIYYPITAVSRRKRK